jgi:hypothetical protein
LDYQQRPFLIKGRTTTERSKHKQPGYIPTRCKSLYYLIQYFGVLLPQISTLNYKNSFYRSPSKLGYYYNGIPNWQYQHMKTLMERLQVEEDRLDQEQKDSGGEYKKMKLVFEKKVDLYKRFLKKEGLTELDRLRLENKKEWIYVTLIIVNRTWGYHQ